MLASGSGPREFDASDGALLESGANAILRLPPGPEWDDRLFRLMNVPVRRETRFEVHLRLELVLGQSGPSFSATGQNLSTNGILVECARPLHLGNDLITGVGTVLRVAPRTGTELRSTRSTGRATA